MTLPFDPRLTRPDNPNPLERLYYALIDGAFDRHAFLSRWLDYLPEQVSIRLFLMVVALILMALTSNFQLGFTMLIIEGFRRVLGHAFSGLVLALWEFLTYWYVLDVAYAVILHVTGDPDANLVNAIGKIAVWIIIMYLACDAHEPPRPRKKVRLRIRERMTVLKPVFGLTRG